MTDKLVMKYKMPDGSQEMTWYVDKNGVAYRGEWGKRERRTRIQILDMFEMYKPKTDTWEMHFYPQNFALVK
jgi:predicted neuraminidase